MSMTREHSYIFPVIIGASKRPKMVGNGAYLSKVRDPTSFRAHAGYRGGLVASTGRSIVDVVVVRDPAVGPAVTSGHPGHHQPGEAIASHREDSRSHGTKATNRRSRSI